MALLKNLAKATLLIIGFIIVGGLTSSINFVAGTATASLACLTALAAIRFPIARLGLDNRPAIVGLLVFSLLAGFASYASMTQVDEKWKRETERLASLKASDPASYLAEVKKSRPEAFYMKELAALNPAAHKREVELAAERLKKAAQERAQKEAFEEAQRRPERLIQIAKFSWSRGGFGTIMNASFVISNKNSFPVKDLRVKCTLSAPSGTIIDSNTRTIYQSIRANGQITLRDFNMGFVHSQSASASCDVTSAIPQ